MFVVYFAIAICQHMGGECKELAYSVGGLIHIVARIFFRPSLFMQ